MCFQIHNNCPNKSKFFKCITAGQYVFTENFNDNQLYKIVNRSHQGSEVWRLSHMVHYTYTVLAKIRSPKEMFLNHFLSEKEALRHYGKF